MKMVQTVEDVVEVMGAVAANEKEKLDDGQISDLDSGRQLVQHSQALLLVHILDRLDQIIRLLGEAT